LARQIKQVAVASIMQQHKLCAGSQLTAATIKNCAVILLELPETNHKLVNEMLIQYKTTGRESLNNNYAALLDIAQQCPSAGGPGVFTARVMLSLITDEIDYDDDVVCLQAGYYRMAQEQLKNVISDIVIVPNPANETVKFIAQNNLEGVCKIKLINAIGKLVFESSFNCSDKVYTLDVSQFAQVIYQAEIEATGIEKKNAKLVIVH
jgi:hypothetical protein